MIITADKFVSDGVAFNMLSRINSSLPFLLLSRVEELSFNEEILKLEGKEYVLVDYIENGWNVSKVNTLILGQNLDEYSDIFKGEGWVKLNEFVKNNPPVLYLKRELLKKDETDRILPIEYPNWQDDYPLQLREEFNNRPISVFNYWGRSHEARLMWHGEIWKNAAHKGYAVCDSLYYLNAFMHHEKNPNKWVTFNIEHYSRIDIKELLKINSLSKLSVSLWGGGIKCFRSTGESIINSVIVMPEDDLAYSYPFINGVNCIQFKTDSVDGVSKEWDIVTVIEEALKNDNLYDIYLEGKKVADFYRIENYIPYLEKLINK